jgi:hypothetical protein
VSVSGAFKGCDEEDEMLSFPVHKNHNEKTVLGINQQVNSLGRLLVTTPHPSSSPSASFSPPSVATRTSS